MVVPYEVPSGKLSLSDNWLLACVCELVACTPQGEIFVKF